MDQPLFDQASQTTKAQSPRKPRRSRVVAQQPLPCSLHPLQEKAVRYVAFMSQDTDKAQSVPEFIVEAIAYHLERTQRQGLEYPPRLLNQLKELQLIK